MKKFFGVLFAAIALVLMVSAMTLVTVEFLLWCELKAGSLEAATWWSKIVDWLFSSRYALYGVSAGLWLLLIVVGSLFNYRFGKAGYALTFVFGILFYGAMLYLVKWGPCKLDLGVSFLIADLFPKTAGVEWLTRDFVLYCGAGVMVLGCIVSAIARLLIGTRRKPKKGVPAKAVPASGAGSAYTSSRDTRREVYVRDPWGNFIRQEDYDARVNKSRSGRK